MKTLALFGLVIAAPVAAQSGSLPSPEDAASKALAQCVQHSSSMQSGMIVKQNSKELAANGLAWQQDPPPLLQQTKSTPYGRADYAEAKTNDGQVWVVGYENGVCQVVTVGTQVPPIEKKYLEVFAGPGNWHAERAPSADKGERKLLYKSQPSRDVKLSALVSMRDDQGFSMVTINRQR